MTAIITNDIKKQIFDNLINNVTVDSDYYYIAIGKSEQWDETDTLVNPVNSTRDQRNARLSMQSMKTAADVSYVIPRHKWSSGTTYTSFDDASSDYPSNSYYIMTDENNVYICLRQGKTTAGISVTSTTKPSGTSTEAFITADGYVWKYLYTIGAIDSTKYLSANYMPVKFVDSAGVGDPATDRDQYDIQNAADSSEILNIVVTTSGTGYTSSPTVEIEGNGSGARAVATVASGAVTKIEMDDSGGSLFFGTGYQYAKINLTGGGGSGAEARAVLGDDRGVGKDPRVDLRSSIVMFNSKPSGDENGDFVIGNDFRQVLLLRNPETVGGSRINSLTANFLDHIQLTLVGDATTFSADQVFTGSISGSQGMIDYIDSDTIFYHQNEDTGFGEFDSDIGSTITAIGASGTISTLDSSGNNIFSGDLLYIQNKAAIERSVSQTEDIKVLIKL